MRVPACVTETGDMHARGAPPQLAAARVDEGRLVRDHLPLVHQAVNDLSRRLPQHVCRDELYSAAMLGLAQAARSFDAGRGIAFERHASNRIRGALLDELRDADWASRSVRSRARRLQRASDDLTSRFGRSPTPTQLAFELGIEVDAVHRLLEDVHRATVLNYDSIVEQGGDELLPTGDAPPEAVLLDRERQSYLIDAVLALPERLRRVVVASFFEERPMHQIAAELGVTESRVSQLRAEALALLRDGLNAHLDPEVVPPEPRPNGRPARRRAAYYAAIAAASDYRSRLQAEPRPVVGRADAAVGAARSR
jgi:RNA polymerase sigma factor for flagellar operon FliA